MTDHPSENEDLAEVLRSPSAPCAGSSTAANCPRSN